MMGIEHSLVKCVWLHRLRLAMGNRNGLGECADMR